MRRWVFTSFGRGDKRRKKESLTDYIDEITNVWFDEVNVLRGWSDNEEEFDGVSLRFIEEQPINWLHRFYKWIAETKGRTDLIKSKPIFLDSNGKAVAALDAKGQPILFLPVVGGSAYTTVQESLLRNEDTCKFLEQLGIKKPSLREEIYNIILPQYDRVNSNAVNADFVKFFRCYLDCPQNQVNDFLDRLRGHDILLCCSSSIKQPHHEDPAKLYFPSEFLLS